MKMLYILNTTNKVNNFSYSSMIAARELDIEFHIAGNWTGYNNPKDKEADEIKYGIKIHQIDFIRQPYDLRNIKAYNQVVELIKREKYDIIHCNTPIGGVIGRLAGKKCGVKKVIYQVHGFHFYEGAPLKNWILYYNAEKILARFTDTIITMNYEDYKVAEKFKLNNDGRVYNVHGVGIDLNGFSGIEKHREIKRKELGFTDDEIVLISMGDLIERKNYNVAIKAIAMSNNPKLQYIICGKGSELKKLQNLSRKLRVEKQIHFLGFRADIKELLAASDIFLFTSLQEGLPRSLMEAMAAGLPCVASKIRGNVDLISNGKGGFLCKPNDIEMFYIAMLKIVNDKLLRQKMSRINLMTIKEYDLSIVINEISKIYEKVLKQGRNT